jgi:hypothetical protein
LSPVSSPNRSMTAGARCMWDRRTEAAVLYALCRLNACRPEVRESRSNQSGLAPRSSHPQSRASPPPESVASTSLLAVPGQSGAVPSFPSPAPPPLSCPHLPAWPFAPDRSAGVTPHSSRRRLDAGAAAGREDAAAGRGGGLQRALSDEGGWTRQQRRQRVLQTRPPARPSPPFPSHRRLPAPPSVASQAPASPFPAAGSPSGPQPRRAGSPPLVRNPTFPSGTRVSIVGIINTDIFPHVKQTLWFLPGKENQEEINNSSGFMPSLVVFLCSITLGALLS